jgi:hypothetical protein
MLACPMDRATLQDTLAAAELHLAEAEHEVANQRELVAALERDGHDADQPTQLLQQLEEVLDVHLADRDRLRKELAD